MAWRILARGQENLQKDAEKGWGSLEAQPNVSPVLRSPHSFLHPSSLAHTLPPLIPSNPSLLVLTTTSGHDGRAATGLTVRRLGIIRSRAVRGPEGAEIRGALGWGASGQRLESVA